MRFLWWWKYKMGIKSNSHWVCSVFLPEVETWHFSYLIWHGLIYSTLYLYMTYSSGYYNFFVLLLIFLDIYICFSKTFALFSLQFSGCGCQSLCGCSTDAIIRYLGITPKCDNQICSIIVMYYYWTYQIITLWGHS